MYPKESRARKLLFWADNPSLRMVRKPNGGGWQRHTDLVSIISNRCVRSYYTPNLKIFLSSKICTVITNLQGDTL